ncbi:protein of unknown function DUF4203 [Trinorchestia longiramus]|nr:protein of unknown function DUF4203 [Trinorchestia longiramus]
MVKALDKPVSKTKLKQLPGKRTTMFASLLSFVTSKTRFFFQKLGVDKDFLAKDLVLPEVRFTDAQKRALGQQVVNDATERSVMWGERQNGVWAEPSYMWVTALPPGGNSSVKSKCEAPLQYDYHIAVAVSCGMMLLFGIVYSLFGYRCFKAVMFLTGFMFGSVVVYLVCLSESLLPMLGNAGVSLAAGLMFGLITMLVQYVGLFMTGFHTGLFLGVAAIAAAYPWWVPSSVWVVVGLLLASGLLLAVLTLYFQKGLTILGTAVSGGALLAATLDYFVEKFVMVMWLVERLVASRESEGVCWFSWLILAVWPLMVCVGALTQTCITGTGIYHAQLVPPKNARSVANAQRLRSREARAEIRQKKYRYLYQVRTAHGDIISQEYIQSLQRKAYPAACDNGTLQSDSTHTTMLPPDHAPLAPLTESEDEGGTSCSRGYSDYQQRPPPPDSHTSISIHPHPQHQFQQHFRPCQQYPQRGYLGEYPGPSQTRAPGHYGAVQDLSRDAVPGRAADSPEYSHSSPSPDDHYSELQYTPSPHSSSSPGNCRHASHSRCQITPPPSPVSPPPPSPPRPHCVPR